MVGQFVLLLFQMPIGIKYVMVYWFNVTNIWFILLYNCICFIILIFLFSFSSINYFQQIIVQVIRLMIMNKTVYESYNNDISTETNKPIKQSSDKHKKHTSNKKIKKKSSNKNQQQIQ